MMKRILFYVLFLGYFMTAFSQKAKVATVSGDTIYYAPDNITREVAKQTAISLAKINAIARKFGTIIENNDYYRILNADGETTPYFVSITESEVKGEWIETIEETVDPIHDENGLWAFKAHVKGKVREIISSGINLKAKLLSNGIEDENETSVFKHKSRLYLSFIAPCDGYLSVFLTDTEYNAYCLLPYSSQTNGIYPIKANTNYVFFDKGSLRDSDRSFVKRVDPMMLVTNRDREVNFVYIVFSPNSYSKPIDIQSDEKPNWEHTNFPRHLDSKDFQKWLSKSRRLDLKMTILKKAILITK